MCGEGEVVCGFLGAPPLWRVRWKDMAKCLVYGKMCDFGCVWKLKEVLEGWIGRLILRNGKWVGLVLQSVWKYTSLGVFPQKNVVWWFLLPLYSTIMCII